MSVGRNSPETWSTQRLAEESKGEHSAAPQRRMATDTPQTGVQAETDNIAEEHDADQGEARRNVEEGVSVQETAATATTAAQRRHWGESDSNSGRRVVGGGAEPHASDGPRAVLVHPDAAASPDLPPL